MNARELAIYERGGAEALAREAERQADAKKRARRVRSQRLASRPGPSRKDEKAAKKEATREETARLRDFADRRDERCVICLEPAPEPWELHHVDSGSGKTERQTTRNTCKTHEGCHKRAHRGDLDALSALYSWANEYGYTETMAVVSRRIAKIEEARAFGKRPRCQYGALVCTHAQCQPSPLSQENETR